MYRLLIATALITVCEVGGGCSLLPTRQTECSAARPCPAGQRCLLETSTCEPFAPSMEPAMDMTMDMASVAGAAADLGEPSLSGMLHVPGGQFMMGSETGQADEMPVNLQTVAAFFLDITEVTTRAFAACVDSGKCTRAPGLGPYCNYTIPGREDHPINCVTLAQATEYCSAYGKRLPTEIEFEYVTRGPAGSKYAWGDDGPSTQPDLCWNGSGVRTCSVYTPPRTLFGKIDENGFYGLSANAREIMGNFLCKYPLTNDGGVDCMPENAQRPIRSSSRTNTNQMNLRGSKRGSFDKNYQFEEIGFRCARS